LKGKCFCNVNNLGISVRSFHRIATASVNQIVSTKITNSVDKAVDISIQLSRMSRPSMLVRAARYGAAATKRGTIAKEGEDEAVICDKLMDEEARLNNARCAGDAGYSPTRHVEVLAKLLAAAGRSPAIGDGA